jgi:hypothetical protein
MTSGPLGSRRRAVVGCAAVVAATATLTASPLATAAPFSALVATPGGTLGPIDVNTNTDPLLGAVTSLPHSVTVSVSLDTATCLASLKKGQTYGISAQGTSYASVSPTSVNSLKCGSTPTVFTISAVQATPLDVNSDPTATTINFLALGPNNGIGKKLGDTSTAVTVVDTTSIVGQCTVNCPPLDEGLPAAPAVANSYLNQGNPVTGACQTKYGNKWRGVVISHIADWMPRPESAKNTWAADHAGQTWWDYVTGEVDSYCGP